MTKHIFDKNLELRNIADAAESSFPASEAALDFRTTPFHYSNSKTDFTAKLVIYGLAVTGTPTDVSIDVEIATDSGFSSNKKTIATLSALQGLSGVKLETTIDFGTARDLLNSLANDGLFIRLTCRVTAGTTPTVDYGAYLTHS